MQKMASLLQPHLRVKLINSRTESFKDLNELCGAEYVHKEKKEPTELLISDSCKVASFDGDADRLIYFKRRGDSGSPVVIDGDK